MSRAGIRSAAALFGVSRATIYRVLRGQVLPKGLRRTDRGRPRKMPAAEMEMFCEVIAAPKICTTNKKRQDLFTAWAIGLLEKHGVETPDGEIRAAPGLLNRATVSRYPALWGYDHARMTRAPAAVRFEAATSNAL